MSTFQMEITICTCCIRPADQCKVAQYWISNGVPLEQFTYQKLYPDDEGATKEV